MKNFNIWILFFLFPIILIAQNYMNEKDNVEQTQEALFYLNNSVLENKYSSSNLVFIEQEGSRNVANAHITSSNSEVVIKQFGNDNFANLNLDAFFIRENITQIGNNNTLRDYSLGSKSNHIVNVNQFGNNQKVYINGSNSLSEKIKINVKGNGKTVFVNNFF
jgi:hypothetical protein